MVAISRRGMGFMISSRMPTVLAFFSLMESFKPVQRRTEDTKNHPKSYDPSFAKQYDSISIFGKEKHILFSQI